MGAEERWKVWEQKKKDMENPIADVSPTDMLTTLVHASASFMLRTGLLLQYEGLSEYQEDWTQRQ